jgi:hypothetical protein
MSMLCRCRAGFGACAAARANTKEGKQAERARQRARWPGRHFRIDELPPGLELAREDRGWIMRRAELPRGRP